MAPTVAQHRFVVVDTQDLAPAAAEMVAAFQAAGAPVYWVQDYVAAGDAVVTLVRDGSAWQAGGTAYTQAAGDDFVIVIHLDVDARWQHLPITMVHEMGHTWGLCHSKDRNNVMYTSSQQVTDIDAAVEDVLAAVRSGGNCQ